MDPGRIHIIISEYASLKRPLTWTVIASHIKLLFITLANALTVKRCKSDTAACSRMRAFTGGLSVIHQPHVPSNMPTRAPNLSGASAENDPECSSNVENILSAGVASSNAVSVGALARHRLRQTFNARILAFCIGAMSSSSTQSSSTSISSLMNENKSGLNLERIKVQHPYWIF